MNFELRPYQEEAARTVLDRLDEALYGYRGKYQRRSSFALSAVMSSGKTVIAAAVIEAMFRGSDEFGRNADPNAVVLWLTDDESLNNQTKNKLIQASELELDQLVTIDSPDFPPILEPRTVYFLNVQKLYDSSVKYTKSTNARSYTLWDTIEAAIEADDRDLYLVIDEAHRGMAQSNGRDTTVLRLINGENDRSPVPVVWGISATTARFDAAMEKVVDRTKLPSVEVPIEDVKESGLLKDAIILRRPDEKGKFDTTLLRHAVHETIEQSKLWADYCAAQGEAIVLPLLLIQVRNDPAHAEMERIIATVQEEWRQQTGLDLGENAIAHVFGDDKDLALAGRTIKHVDPESVQDRIDIRVLLAKNAVTTGWDCPRAEVLISLRGSEDETVITQLMGRMFRTPLTRRIIENDVLNTVVCILPHFNQAKTEKVVALLERGDDGKSGGIGPTIILGPTEVLHQNQLLSAEVFQLFGELPSESKPDPKAKPVPRLFSLATALAGDDLLEDAIEQASEMLTSVLDGQLALHKKEVDQAALDIREARIAGLIVNLKEGGRSAEAGLKPLRGDTRVIEDAFSSAARALGKAVVVRYLRHRAEQERPSPKADLDLVEAKLRVAALGTIPLVVEALQEAATKRVSDWLSQYDVAIAGLKDQSRAVYDRIRDKSPTPSRRSTHLPVDGLLVQTGTDTEPSEPFATAPLHLMSDDNGEFPIGQLNEWEQAVIKTELGRPVPKVVGWYRNPSQAKESSIQIPYVKPDGNWGSFQPDFIFFAEVADGSISASLIEPHRDQGDSISKLRGLAEFVERYPNAFLRVEFIEQNNSGEMMKLSLTDPEVRKAIADATSAKTLFLGPLAQKYF